MAGQYLLPEISERIVLVDFWDDPILWRLRLPLHSTGTAGVWICASPDLAVERICLNAHRVVMLKDYGGNLR